MAITEFDLYKSEWLELVFDDRNRAYGAYDLRKHYAGNMIKAMGATFLAVIGLFTGYGFYLKAHPLDQRRFIPDISIIKPIDFKKTVIPPSPPKHVDPPVQHQTVKFPPMAPIADDQAQNPPNTDQIKLSVIGQEDKKGTTDDGLPGLEISPVTPGKDVTESNVIETSATVEVMPQFPGGEAALAKFLQKNLRYPPQAADAGVGGKVYMSFVVEKDGTISNITVERGVGYGLDQEATRVLKLVPPWKPGIQNGHSVRVRYTMPFNFQVPVSDN